MLTEYSTAEQVKREKNRFTLYENDVRLRPDRFYEFDELMG